MQLYWHVNVGDFRTLCSILQLPSFLEWYEYNILLFEILIFRSIYTNLASNNRRSEWFVYQDTKIYQCAFRNTHLFSRIQHAYKHVVYGNGSSGMICHVQATGDQLLLITSTLWISFFYCIWILTTEILGAARKIRFLMHELEHIRSIWLFYQFNFWISGYQYVLIGINYVRLVSLNITGANTCDSVASKYKYIHLRTEILFKMGWNLSNMAQGQIMAFVNEHRKALFLNNFYLLQAVITTDTSTSQ